MVLGVSTFLVRHDTGTRSKYFLKPCHLIWFYLPETAMILPGKFGAINNEVAEADSYDVRQNLKTWHREERNTDEYCVVFRVEKAMKSCKLNEDTKSLVRGADGEHKKLSFV